MVIFKKTLKLLSIQPAVLEVVLDDFSKKSVRSRSPPMRPVRHAFPRGHDCAPSTSSSAAGSFLAIHRLTCPTDITFHRCTANLAIPVANYRPPLSMLSSCCHGRSHTGAEERLLPATRHPPTHKPWESRKTNASRGAVP
jgi:hypothetical protein